MFRLEANVNRGQRQFAVCAACHGADGDGAPQGNVPVIAGQHQRVIAQQLIDYRHRERWVPQMEQVADRHNFNSSQDIAELAGYASTLQRRMKQGQGDDAHVANGHRPLTGGCILAVPEWSPSRCRTSATWNPCGRSATVRPRRNPCCLNGIPS
ncbi:MAG: c-type cytochrome [Pseudomonadota bacterium]